MVEEGQRADQVGCLCVVGRTVRFSGEGIMATSKSEAVVVGDRQAAGRAKVVQVMWSGRWRRSRDVVVHMGWNDVVQHSVIRLRLNASCRNAKCQRITWAGPTPC